MSDLLAQGSAWLESQRKQFATRPATYRRGVLTVVVLATIGRTEFEQDDGYGVIVQSQSRDYLIDAEDLILGGEQTMPARGDWIEETAGGTTYRYEVLPIGNQQHWRYSDPYRQTLRIHTKQVFEETLP
jgi:hypothetical protein